MSPSHVIVIGAGIFGATSALALRSRGYRVTLLDPGPLPHPLAASTDISKVIRMEYGPDESYMSLMERAHRGWLDWNARWKAERNDPLYHETGVVMLCREPMAPGGFEYESFHLLEKRGHHPVRLDASSIAKRYPAWRSGHYLDGFFHAKGGYAESGRVVAALIDRCVCDGVQLRDQTRVLSLTEKTGRVTGVTDQHGHTIHADSVIVAAGAWTAKLLPELEPSIRPSAHPVFHFRPQTPELFHPDHFPTFTADVSRTGYYGFPIHRDGVVKVANHGPGTGIDPDAPREVPPQAHERVREFLRNTFPDLAGAEVVYTRLCLYADTQDEDFWIAPHPERSGLLVAGGGSGHGFKFAPVIGDLVVDALERKENAWLEKFRWRANLRLKTGHEAARYHGGDLKR